MKLTRREMLEMAGWLAIAAPAAAQTKDAEGLDATRARAAEVIRGYSAEGDHRTATPVDRASADRRWDDRAEDAAMHALSAYGLDKG